MNVVFFSNALKSGNGGGDRLWQWCVQFKAKYFGNIIVDML